MEITTLIPVDRIARIAHEANREYATFLGEEALLQHKKANPALLPWEQLDSETMHSAITGVQAVIKDPYISPEALHNCWLETKKEFGWKYGPAKDVVAKTHPCIVPYGELPEAQRRKDVLFRGIVSMFLVLPAHGELSSGQGTNEKMSIPPVDPAAGL